MTEHLKSYPVTFYRKCPGRYACPVVLHTGWGCVALRLVVLSWECMYVCMRVCVVCMCAFVGGAFWLLWPVCVCGKWSPRALLAGPGILSAPHGLLTVFPVVTGDTAQATCTRRVWGLWFPCIECTWLLGVGLVFSLLAVPPLVISCCQSQLFPADARGLVCSGMCVTGS